MVIDGMKSIQSLTQRLWNRHWRITLIVAALMAVFVLGALFGQQLTLRDLESMPTPTLVPTITSTPTPGTGALLILKGDIVDIKTHRPIVADVYLGDDRVEESVTQVDLTVTMAMGRFTEIRIEAPGYHPWGIAVKGGGEGHRIEGPIQLIPIEPTVPADRDT